MPYKKVPCKICGKLIQPIYSRTEFNHSGLCKDCYKTQIDNDKLKHWLETGDAGTKPTSTIRGVIRKYIYQKQNQCCAICGIKNEWNGKELKFILDHIDGDASNNEESNLRLICPNCDSQLDTYKSKNKNSARNRKKYTQITTE